MYILVVPANLTVFEIVSPIVTTTRYGRLRIVPRGELNMCRCGCGEHHSGTMVRCRADGCTRLVNPRCSNCSATWKCVDHRNINAKDVETIDVIESEDDDDELMALPGDLMSMMILLAANTKITLTTRCKVAMMMMMMMMMILPVVSTALSIIIPVLRISH